MIELLLKIMGWVFIIVAFGWATALIAFAVMVLIAVPMDSFWGTAWIEVFSIGGGLIAINTQFNNPVITAIAIAVVVIGVMLELKS